MITKVILICAQDFGKRSQQVKLQTEWLYYSYKQPSIISTFCSEYLECDCFAANDNANSKLVYIYIYIYI